MTLNDAAAALVPEGGIHLSTIAVYSFIDDEGDVAYGTFYDGDVNALEVIGMLEVMKSNIAARPDIVTDAGGAE